jgi:hypothetical protein
MISALTGSSDARFDRIAGLVASLLVVGLAGLLFIGGGWDAQSSWGFRVLFGAVAGVLGATAAGLLHGSSQPSESSRGMLIRTAGAAALGLLTLALPPLHPMRPMPQTAIDAQARPGPSFQALDRVALARAARIFAGDVEPEARAALLPLSAAIADAIDTTPAAAETLLGTLGRHDVSPESLTQVLDQLAHDFIATRRHLAAFGAADPDQAALFDAAASALEQGKPEEADLLLGRAAAAARDSLLPAAPQIEEARGDIALTRLDYQLAAEHFGLAIERLPSTVRSARGRLLQRQAAALDAFGRNQDGPGLQNAALEDSIKLRLLALAEAPRAERPLEWAAEQRVLADALWQLGTRETGTARLEQAVASWQASLEAAAASWPADRIVSVRSAIAAAQIEIARRAVETAGGHKG